MKTIVRPPYEHVELDRHRAHFNSAVNMFHVRSIWKSSTDIWADSKNIYVPNIVFEFGRGERREEWAFNSESERNEVYNQLTIGVYSGSQV